MKKLKQTEAPLAPPSDQALALSIRIISSFNR